MGSMPVPRAARDLGKFFDLRGELSTINHVRRARCRQRSKTPVLLNAQVQQQPARSLTSLSQYGTKQAPTMGRRAVKAPKVYEVPSPPPSARALFPSSLQVLYLAPPRFDVFI